MAICVCLICLAPFYLQGAVSLQVYDQELYDFSAVFDDDMSDAVAVVDQNLQPFKKTARYKPARYKPVAQQQLERQQARDQLVLETINTAALYRDSTVRVPETTTAVGLSIALLHLHGLQGTLFCYLANDGYGVFHHR
jgi:hypothetical protein